MAIKRIDMKRGKRPEKAILKEATIHEKLAHKNIVKFIGTYMNRTHVFFVTEFIEGQNMEDIIYLNDEQVDMPRRKVDVAVGVLEAVAYLHELQPQIIHQDIKPANILIDEAGNPKLCDLGLARMRHGVASSASSVGLHAPGTPAYMPPETLLDNEKGTASSDIWSLGITLIEWFAGRDPWQLEDQMEDPIVYIRKRMQKKEMPPIMDTFTLPLLLPCIRYTPADQPTARQMLLQFQCPTCSVMLF